MEEKLNIVAEERDTYILLKIEGRIDGYWSKPLEEYLDETLRKGNYNVALDLRAVNYMSSLGIRILVKFKKLYNQVNGEFGILEASRSVTDLLEMAGLNTVLRWQAMKSLEEEKDTSSVLEKEGYSFKISRIGKVSSMECFFTGDPGKTRNGGFAESDSKSISFDKKRYGIGMGAIGLNYEDCRERFGEFIALGNSVVYSPAGKPGSPDYMLRSGALIPSIQSLYGIIFEGDFDTIISFSSPDQSKTISFEELLSTVFEITSYRQFVMVMLAESSGLVGMSINKSPAQDGSDHQNPFMFPGIRESISLTTEPDFKQMMTITAGLAGKTNGDETGKFLRPASPGSEVLQHFHSAIFSYHPLKKSDINLEEAISAFFEHDKIRGVLHLLNDSREITGIGQSEFKGGVCWIGNIDSPIKTR